MKQFRVIKNRATKEVMERQRRMFHDTISKDMMRVTYEDGTEIDFFILKGKSFTPSGCVRDCGDHYIKANYSTYTRIDKDTMSVTEDVEDR